MSEPVTPDVTTGNYPVAPKVKWAAAGTYLGGVVMTALFAGFQDGNFISFLPDGLSPFVLPIIPSIAAWIAGYRAKHQYRAGETG